MIESKIRPNIGRVPRSPGIQIVVGIDGSAVSDHALDLTCQLDFCAPQHYVLVNAVGVDSLSDTDLRVRESGGMTWLKAALRKVEDLDSKAEELQVHGPPSPALIRIAEEEKADLVVVGHHRDSQKRVAEQLIEDCARHVLIGRSSIYVPSDLVAVLITGSSLEADSCISEFIRLAPQGLRRVYVLVADRLDWDDTGHTVAERLFQAGFDAEPITEEGSDMASEICRICGEKKADLVVFADPVNLLKTRPNGESVPAAILGRCAQSVLVLRPDITPLR